MELEELRSWCLDRPGTTEGYPFGPGALVMKVAGKMFALIGEGEETLTISLKCDPGLAEVLRDSYDAVVPGYHMNKRHWNTVTVGSDAGDDLLRDWIDDSYDLVVDGLPRAVREELRQPDPQ